MDALDVAKVCLRRWYVVLPVILLAVGAGLSMTSSRPSSYSGTAAFALIYTHADELKPNQPDPRTKNPLIAGGGYGLLTETLVGELSSPTTQRELAAPGLSIMDPSTPNGPALATGRLYSVAAPQNSASIIISAYGPTPQAVEQTLKNVLAAAPQRAEQIQSRLGAPRLAQLTTTVTAQPEIVQLPPPSPLKLLIAITGVGCLAAAGLALVVERLAARRRRRRQLEAMLDGDDERPHSRSTSHKAEPVR